MKKIELDKDLVLRFLDEPGKYFQPMYVEMKAAAGDPIQFAPWPDECAHSYVIIKGSDRKCIKCHRVVTKEKADFYHGRTVK